MVDVFVDARNPIVFPVGWAVRQGYPIECTKPYSTHCKRILSEGDGAYLPNDARPEHFDYALADFEVPAGVSWKVGYCFELLDYIPENDKPHSFRVATCERVLEDRQWLCVRLQDAVDRETYPVHVRSLNAVPLGTATRYGMPLLAPRVDRVAVSVTPFDHEAYLKRTMFTAAPKALFDSAKAHKKLNQFQRGHRLEAVDVVEHGVDQSGHSARCKGRPLRRHQSRRLASRV